MKEAKAKAKGETRTKHRRPGPEKIHRAVHPVQCARAVCQLFACSMMKLLEGSLLRRQIVDFVKFVMPWSTRVVNRHSHIGSNAIIRVHLPLDSVVYLLRDLRSAALESMMLMGFAAKTDRSDHTGFV